MKSATTPGARAKIFANGRSQAVRLPREFRFDAKEVAIPRDHLVHTMLPLEAGGIVVRVILVKLGVAMGGA